MNNCKPSLENLVKIISSNNLLFLFSRSAVSDSFATSWTVARQDPLSMQNPRQENWSGLLFPPPGNLDYQGIKPMSLAFAGGFLTTEP